MAAIPARGGSFLIQERQPGDFFTPEDFARRVLTFLR